MGLYNRRDLREYSALFGGARPAGAPAGDKLQPPPRFALRAQPLSARRRRRSEPLDCIRIRTLAVCAWLRRCRERHFGQLSRVYTSGQGVRGGGTSAAEERGKRGRRRLGREWREQRAALRTKRRCTLTAVTKGATRHASRGDCCSGQGGRDGQRPPSPVPLVTERVL